MAIWEVVNEPADHLLQLLCFYILQRTVNSLSFKPSKSVTSENPIK